MERRIGIIGGGLSGLSAGIHLLQFGFKNVAIYEKQQSAGGFCTSYVRNGYEVDLCIHWLTGTNKKSPYYALWKNIGGLDDNIEIINPEYFTKYRIDGKEIIIWSDIERLRTELTKVSIEDKELIDDFCDAAKAYSVLDKASKKPNELYSDKERMLEAFSTRSAIKYIKKYGALTLDEFAAMFQNKTLKKVFETIMPGGYNTHYLLLTLNNYSMQNAGIPQGGSRGLSERVLNKYLTLGGRIEYDKEVISVSNNKVIEFKNKEKVQCDSVVCCIDSYYFYSNILKENENIYSLRLKNPISYPMVSCILVCFAANVDAAISENFSCALNCGIIQRDSLYYRYYSYDKTIVSEKKLLTCLITTNFNESKAIINLRENKEEYNKFKKELALKIQKCLADKFSIDQRELELLDVVTPASFARFNNATYGSYMAFVPHGSAPVIGEAFRTGINGIYNGSMWALDYGGTPLAALSGRLVAQLIAFDNGLEYSIKDIS